MWWEYGGAEMASSVSARAAFDSSRDGGDSRENRRSLTEFIGLDSSQYSEPAAAPKQEHQRPNEVGGSTSAERDWRWEEWEAPGSPEAAQTPHSLVPSTCFPPRHPATFASYSESARPGSLGDDTSGQMTDLVASLKSLVMAPPPSTSGSLYTSTERHSYESADKMVEPWSPEQASTSHDANNKLPRGAFFCGVVQRGADDRTMRWCGVLPARGPPPGAEATAAFSPKVFLGGLPWDITEEALMHSLRHFYPIRVEWPGREGGGAGEGSAPRGFAYVTFESERRVRALLAAARRDRYDWYYRIASHNMRTKETDGLRRARVQVQVIPWALGDACWARAASRLEPARTVFVGALHGMLSAFGLALIMNDLFDGVVYAGIDTDKNKYPIGSGRVTFNNLHSYMTAVSAAYVEICTDKFTKTIQIDPYLEDSMCSLCNLQQGPYFCREPVCFRYFCRSCWAWQHRSVSHKQLMRNSKSAAGGPPSTQRHSPPAPAPAAPRHSPRTPSGQRSERSERSQRRHSSDPACYNGGSNGNGRPSEGTPSSGSSGTSELESSTAGEVAAEPWVLR
ncbi:unnamed protein product [Parnassius apollo]|uniref:(apollo) hypothetical protein n=1 Tax=Parnassius apollo TaxID=110799 RepID=A0A8S3W0R0_PARAO|nr:unnamed protein product [Parnassius apollo]